MASFASACRITSRLAARQLRHDVAARGFRTSAACLAAHSFNMPALSPTMTEGNIAKWNVKEGDAFSVGDVLLEIETDKASMDVEAQDDGIMAKITQGDGTKGIKVGTRIGVLAEPGDDLNTLEIPAEESAPAPPAPKAEASKPKPKAPQAEAAPPPPPPPPPSESAKAPLKRAKKQTYPLLPSVEHLLRQYGLESSTIEKMTPSGPNNRLLKGDVLAYLGSISASYPTDLSSKIAKYSRLDLSNVKVAPPVPPKAPEQTEPAKPAKPPLSAKEQTELFYQVLGLRKAPLRNATTQQLPLPTQAFSPPSPSVRKPDIIDILVGKPKPQKAISQKKESQKDESQNLEAEIEKLRQLLQYQSDSYQKILRGSRDL